LSVRSIASEHRELEGAGDERSGEVLAQSLSGTAGLDAGQSASASAQALATVVEETKDIEPANTDANDEHVPTEPAGGEVVQTEGESDATEDAARQTTEITTVAGGKKTALGGKGGKKKKGKKGAAVGEDGEPIVRKPRVAGHSLDVSVNRLKTLDFAHGITYSIINILNLNISGNLLVSLEGIQACKYLRILDASDNMIESMAPLAECSALKRVRICGNRLTSVGFVETSGTELIKSARKAIDTSRSKKPGGAESSALEEEEAGGAKGPVGDRNCKLKYLDLR